MGIIGGLAAALACRTFRASDPSWNVAGMEEAGNWLGRPGASIADTSVQLLGLAAAPAALTLAGFCALALVRGPGGVERRNLRIGCALGALALFSAAISGLPPADAWPMATGFGGLIRDGLLGLLALPLSSAPG